MTFYMDDAKNPWIKFDANLDELTQETDCDPSRFARLRKPGVRPTDTNPYFAITEDKIAHDKDAAVDKKWTYHKPTATPYGRLLNKGIAHKAKLTQSMKKAKKKSW